VVCEAPVGRGLRFAMKCEIVVPLPMTDLILKAPPESSLVPPNSIDLMSPLAFPF